MLSTWTGADAWIGIIQSEDLGLTNRPSPDLGTNFNLSQLDRALTKRPDPVLGIKFTKIGLET